MAGDFDDVLAREGARRAHDREQDFVHVLPVAHDMAVVNGVRRGARVCGRLAGRRETAVRDRQRLRAGNADDGQPAFAERRGNGGYGVVQHREEVRGKASQVASG